MTRTRFIRACGLLTTALFALACAPVFAQSVPQTISLQGRLARPDGTPVADRASQSLTFRLYSAATGGTLLWSQSGAVPVRNGVFAARLDFASGYTTGNSLATIFGSSTFTPYLEIQVGTDAPLAPRQPFSSVAYALYSTTASLALAVPNGSVTSANIADNSITSAKLARDAASLAKVSGTALTSDGANIGIGLNSFLAVGLTDRFTIDGKSVGAASLGWYSDSWNTFGATAWLTGYSGIKLFTGVSTPPRLVITQTGNIGIGTATPDMLLTVGGDMHTSSNLTVDKNIYASESVNAAANLRVGGKTLIGPSTTLNNPAIYGEALVVDGATRLFDNLRVDGTNGLSLTGSGAGVKFPDGTIQKTASVAIGASAGGDLTGIFPNPTIAANAVTTTKIADSSVTTAKIADANVTTSKLADTAVTSAKLASSAASLNKVSGGVMISDGSRIGIGTVSPVAPLHVVGNLRASGKAFIGPSTTLDNFPNYGEALVVDGAVRTFGSLRVDTTVSIGLNSPAADYNLNVNGSIGASGQVRANGVILTSDARYKTHVATFANALDTILGLRGVTFDWNRDKWQEKSFPTGRQVGFLAQEVESVLPELVTTDANGYKAVAYQNVVPVLVEAVKTLNAKVDAQNQEIAELKRQNARITELEAKINALLSASQSKLPR